MKPIILFVSVALALGACTMQSPTSTPTAAIASKTVFEAISARAGELEGVHHGGCEDAAFYAVVGNMQFPSQVREYYSQQGFNMSEDGSGGTAIAALTEQPFTGRMPGKAVCFQRAESG